MFQKCLDELHPIIIRHNEDCTERIIVSPSPPVLKASFAATPGSLPTEHSLQADGMATTFFYTGEEPAGTSSPTFPPDYEIMIFDPILTPAQKQQHRSYLFCHGVAVSLHRNEIVYWSAVW